MYCAQLNRGGQGKSVSNTPVYYKIRVPEKNKIRNKESMSFAKNEKSISEWLTTEVRYVECFELKKSEFM